MTDSRQCKEDVLSLIMNEVDEAREAHELVKQLEPALPIKSFDDIKKACGDKGTITFRGTAFKVGIFEEIMPKIAFPIEDTRTLVERVVQLIRMVPKFIANDPKNIENAKRHMRRLAMTLGALPNGLPAMSPFTGGALFPGVSLAEQSRGAALTQGTQLSHKEED